MIKDLRLVEIRGELIVCVIGHYNVKTFECLWNVIINPTTMTENTLIANMCIKPKQILNPTKKKFLQVSTLVHTVVYSIRPLYETIKSQTNLAAGQKACNKTVLLKQYN